MRKMGVSVLEPQPGNSCRNPQDKVFPYLRSKLVIKRSNPVSDNLTCPLPALPT